MFNFSRPSTPVQPEMGLFLEIDVNMQNGSTDRDAVCDIKNKKATIRWQDSARRQFQAGLRGDVGL